MKAITSRDKIQEAYNQQAEIVSWLKSNLNKLVEQTITLKKKLKEDIENVSVQKDEKEADTLRKELAEVRLWLFFINVENKFFKVISILIHSEKERNISFGRESPRADAR